MHPLMAPPIYSLSINSPFWTLFDKWQYEKLWKATPRPLFVDCNFRAMSITWATVHLIPADGVRYRVQMEGVLLEMYDFLLWITEPRDLEQAQYWIDYIGKRITLNEENLL